MVREGIAINTKNCCDLDFFTWISCINSHSFFSTTHKLHILKQIKLYKKQIIETESQKDLQCQILVIWKNLKIILSDDDFCDTHTNNVQKES